MLDASKVVYPPLFDSRKTSSYELVGRSAVDSGIGFGLSQIILERTHPAIGLSVASATRTGMNMRSLGLRP